MNLYEVLPFTANYQTPISEGYRVFEDESQAYEYANQFKFSRELGEILRINGVEWRVGVIAEDRNSIIKVLNEIVRVQNSIVRKRQRELDREINHQINQMFLDAYKSVMNY